MLAAWASVLKQQDSTLLRPLMQIQYMWPPIKQTFPHAVSCKLTYSNSPAKNCDEKRIYKTLVLMFFLVDLRVKVFP